MNENGGLRPLADAIGNAAKAAREIEYQVAKIDSLSGPRRTPAKVELCKACATNEPDPRRAGYCKPCYSRFDDYGRPDRAAFEAWVRGDRAEPPDRRARLLGAGHTVPNSAWRNPSL